MISILSSTRMWKPFLKILSFQFFYIFRQRFKTQLFSPKNNLFHLIYQNEKNFKQNILYLLKISALTQD